MSHPNPPRRAAAHAAAAALRADEATKRAALLELMGDRLAAGPAPVPIYGLVAELAAAGVPGFTPTAPGRAGRRTRAHKMMVRSVDALLDRLISDGYLKRGRWQPRAKGGAPMAYVWDLGPRVTNPHGVARLERIAAGGAR